MKHENLIVIEGYPFIIFSFIITIFVAFFGNGYLIAFFLLLSAFVVWFFRNPDRSFQDEEKLIISPADGKVVKIEEVEHEGAMAGKFKKISIFMNVFNVHVNRASYRGKIEAIHYHEGKFLSANLDKASRDNERNEIMLRMDDGRVIWIVQIAGLIARRIVCWVKKGDEVAKGERIGLICFGSRVDLYLPQDARISVKLNDKVKGGETPLGYLS